MRVGALRTVPHEVGRRIIRTAQIASLYAICDQTSRRHHPVWIQRDRALVRGIRLLEHLFPSPSESGVEVISLPQGFPCWRVARIDPYSPLQHFEGFLVGARIMRLRYAAQVKVISLL